MPFPNDNSLVDAAVRGTGITQFNVGDREFAVYVDNVRDGFNVVEILRDPTTNVISPSPIVQDLPGGNTYNGVLLETDATSYGFGPVEMLTHTTSSGDQYIIGGQAGQVVFKATNDPNNPLELLSSSTKAELGITNGQVGTYMNVLPLTDAGGNEIGFEVISVVREGTVATGDDTSTGLWGLRSVKYDLNGVVTSGADLVGATNDPNTALENGLGNEIVESDAGKFMIVVGGDDNAEYFLRWKFNESTGSWDPLPRQQYLGANDHTFQGGLSHHVINGTGYVYTGYGAYRLEANGNLTLIQTNQTVSSTIYDVEDYTAPNGDMYIAVQTAQSEVVGSGNGLRRLYEVNNDGTLTLIDTSNYSFSQDAQNIEFAVVDNYLYGITGEAIGSAPIAVVCFTAGSVIETKAGPKNIEDLKVGDLVPTKDRGDQPVRWVGINKVSAAELAANPKLAPVRISAGALGNGMPARDMWVSRQHRVLIGSELAERLTGEREILVPAIALTKLPGVFVDEAVEAVTYVHVLFDQHEIVWVDGVETESLYTGKHALAAMRPEAREEILTLFPELGSGQVNPTPARPLIKGKEAKQVVMRHRDAHLAVQSNLQTSFEVFAEA